MKLYIATILFFVTVCHSKPLPQHDEERGDSQLVGGGVPNQTSGGTSDLSQPGQTSSGFNTVLASGMGGGYAGGFPSRPPSFPPIPPPEPQLSITINTNPNNYLHGPIGGQKFRIKISIENVD